MKLEIVAETRVPNSSEKIQNPSVFFNYTLAPLTVQILTSRSFFEN